MTSPDWSFYVASQSIQFREISRLTIRHRNTSSYFILTPHSLNISVQIYTCIDNVS